MRRFLPLAGACGREGFWAWACARDSRDARAWASAQGGRSASQAKAPGMSPGASFLSPLSLAIQRNGARGWRGRVAPEVRRGLPCVRCCAPVRRRKRHGVVRIATRHYNNHDAARRIATIFEKWNCLIEISLPARRENPPQLNPCRAFRRGSLLEYGGLKPILPFLEGRSDAARRVVIPPSRLPPRRLYGFHYGAARLWGTPHSLGRALAALGISPTKSAMANRANW